MLTSELEKPDLDINESEMAATADIQEAVDEPDRILPAIEFRDVHLSFDDKKILNGISFTVRRNENYFRQKRRRQINNDPSGARIVKARFGTNSDRRRRHHALYGRRNDAR